MGSSACSSLLTVRKQPLLLTLSEEHFYLVASLSMLYSKVKDITALVMLSLEGVPLSRV
jgi:hypothetical protein